MIQKKIEKLGNTAEREIANFMPDSSRRKKVCEN